MESSYTFVDLPKRASIREGEPHVTPLDPSQRVPSVLEYVSYEVAGVATTSGPVGRSVSLKSLSGNGARRVPHQEKKKRLREHE